MSWGNIDWGDAPTWAATAFAGAAAWFTYQTIKSQQKQIDEQRDFIAEQAANLRLGRDELKAAAEERRTAQVRGVTMNFSPGIVSEGRSGPVLGHRVTAEVRNENPDPIRDVLVLFGPARLPPERVNHGAGTPVPVLGGLLHTSSPR